jgi:hypothetical protein
MDRMCLLEAFHSAVLLNGIFPLSDLIPFYSDQQNCFYLIMQNL